MRWRCQVSYALFDLLLCLGYLLTVVICREEPFSWFYAKLAVPYLSPAEYCNKTKLSRSRETRLHIRAREACPNPCPPRPKFRQRSAQDHTRETACRRNMHPTENSRERGLGGPEALGRYSRDPVAWDPLRRRPAWPLWMAVCRHGWGLASAIGLDTGNSADIIQLASPGARLTGKDWPHPGRKVSVIASLSWGIGRSLRRAPECEPIGGLCQRCWRSCGVISH